jgi:hypothetical protein
MPTPALERIRAALAAAASSKPEVTSRTEPDGPPLALGWATVELDRAASELAGELGIPPTAFVAAFDSEILGARCRVAEAALPDGVSLAILEPASEGRIAATLARLGEGPAVVWLAVDDDIVAGASAARPGPFGPERLVLGGPVHGPHRLLVETGPGTIRP